MKLTMIGSRFAGRPGCGVYEIAYDVATDSGNTGKVVRTYEYEDRDILNDTVYTSPGIAEEIREWMGDCAPDYFAEFCCPDENEGTKNWLVVLAAKEECTTLVYGEEL